MKRLLIMLCLALPASTQTGPLVRVRFYTRPEAVSVYQEVSSAERPGRYLGRSDKLSGSMPEAASYTSFSELPALKIDL